MFQFLPLCCLSGAFVLYIFFRKRRKTFGRSKLKKKNNNWLVIATIVTVYRKYTVFTWSKYRAPINWFQLIIINGGVRFIYVIIGLSNPSKISALRMCWYLMCVFELVYVQYVTSWSWTQRKYTCFYFGTFSMWV